MIRRYRQNTAIEMECKNAMLSREFFEVSGNEQNKQ
jgi:hypothetical protein